MCKSNDYLSGIDAYIKALELNPQLEAGYLYAADAYLKLDQQESAQRVCELGIEFAEKHIHEPWAEKLIASLEKAKGIILKRR